MVQKMVHKKDGPQETFEERADREEDFDIDLNVDNIHSRFKDQGISDSKIRLTEEIVEQLKSDEVRGVEKNEVKSE